MVGEGRHQHRPLGPFRIGIEPLDLGELLAGLARVAARQHRLGAEVDLLRAAVLERGLARPPPSEPGIEPGTELPIRLQAPRREGEREHGGKCQYHDLPNAPLPCLPSDPAQPALTGRPPAANGLAQLRGG